MAQVAITYPAVTVNEMTGAALEGVLEDVADNLFNPDPYYQQGGDMVRVGRAPVQHCAHRSCRRSAHSVI